MPRNGPDPIDIEVGRRIRARRLSTGLSQSSLAKGLDLTFQQVQKYEKGVNRVGAGRLQRIAHILDVPVTFFFDGQLRQGAKTSIETVSGFEFLSNARALRLMKSFSRIQNSKIQDALATLSELLAEECKKRSK